MWIFLSTYNNTIKLFGLAALNLQGCITLVNLVLIIYWNFTLLTMALPEFKLWSSPSQKAVRLPTEDLWLFPYYSLLSTFMVAISAALKCFFKRLAYFTQTDTCGIYLIGMAWLNFFENVRGVSPTLLPFNWSLTQPVKLFVSLFFATCNDNFFGLSATSSKVKKRLLHQYLTSLAAFVH